MTLERAEYAAAELFLDRDGAHRQHIRAEGRLDSEQPILLFQCHGVWFGE